MYVDDISLANNDLNMKQSIKSWLNSKFEMKDMREASYVLGIKITRNRKCRKLCLSQERYLATILKHLEWKIAN